MVCLPLLLACFGARADAPLFSSHDVLEISIPLNFKSLCRPRDSEDCDFAPTTLEYRTPDSEKKTLAVEVIIRGGWRSLVKNCSAPLLFVRFDQGNTAGTPFEGQSLLPLTTHCGQGLSLEAARGRPPKASWEQYLLKEYLAHRLYNAVTRLSLQARLVKIRYPNPDKPRRLIENYAFFTEHFDSLAARSGAERLARGSFDHTRLDAQAAAVLALFQFMIGNTDFSVVRERNIILLDRAGRQFPVPYDFDMSGLVNAHYAGPAPALPIDSVSERYYLGYCQPDIDWDALFGLYLDRSDAILSLVKQVPDLNRSSRKTTHRFLQQFFRLLKDPEARLKTVSGHCLDWPPDPEDHMMPFAR
jgi:hypothetical protein